MKREVLPGFIKQAEEHFSSIRGSILVCARAGNIYGEMFASLRQIDSIKKAAAAARLDEIVKICEDFEKKLKTAADSKEALSDAQARRLLDKLAELEAATTELYFGANGFSENVSGFVEDSFRRFQIDENDSKTSFRSFEKKDEFEINDEMLEVFTLEADQLTENIRANLEKLKNSPSDSEALLEIRRGAHTLKGSAATAGFKNLSQIAHRIEDLLDYAAANKIEFGEQFLNFYPLQ
jgi:chemotaxis protein histidine kinase CheA